jgi:hypothetical protein
MPATIHVTEQLLSGLLTDKAAQSKFPFLRNAAVRMNVGRDSCCGRKARRTTDLQMLKLTLFGMATQELQRLKQHLGADKLVFTLVNHSGAYTQHER